ncbi:MAG: hypothetical protein ACI9M9_001713 [Flavobacteriaceae bacterium]|jgi:hypothetical protein
MITIILIKLLRIMKTTNQFFTLLFTLVLLSSTFSVFAQDAPARPAYVVSTTLHWNMDYEDFDLDEWEAVEKEYLDKVTMKNEYIMGSSVYMHRYTADNSELMAVASYASWADIDKAADRNAELEKAAWPDENARKAFLKKQNAYYSVEHSDEIYAPLPGAKLMLEKATKDYILYLRKSHFSFPEDGSQEEFKTLRMEEIENVINKNEYIKAYFPNVHAWGSDRTEFIEAFYFETMADIEESQKRGDELAKAALPDENGRKDKGEKWAKYFTGVHGDYIYTLVSGLSK